MGGGIVRHGEGFRHPGPGGGPLDDQLPRTHASRMGNGTGRYAVLTKRLIDSGLGTPGHTTTHLRLAVLLGGSVGGRAGPAAYESVGLDAVARSGEHRSELQSQGKLSWPVL